MDAGLPAARGSPARGKTCGHDRCSRHTQTLRSEMDFVVRFRSTCRKAGRHNRSIPGFPKVVMLSAFLHGYFLALGLILPLGPQNAFILSQGVIARRWRDVLPVVLAACVSDSLLIVLAVFGVSAVVLTVPWFRTALIVAGVCFLVYIGWLNWRSAAKPAVTEAAAPRTLRQQLVFTLAVSLLNPHAILDTIGVIGTSALAYSGNERLVFGLACVLNSCLWFTGLSLAGRVFGRVGNLQKWLARASAVVMWLSALFLIRSLFAI